MKTRSKTRLMRVPCSFHEKTKMLSKKYGYNKVTEFIDKDVNKILENADYINEKLIMRFFKK